MHRRMAFSIVAFAAGAAALSLAVAWAAIWWASPKDAEAAPPPQSSQTRTVDWYYWLDLKSNGVREIQRARLDGSRMVETVVTYSEFYKGYYFALDPDGDYVYWLDGTADKVRRKLADGSGSVEDLVSSGISSPSRIVVDDSYVYWSDNTLNTIKKAETSGSHTVTTIANSSDGVDTVTAIGLYGNYLYWTEASGASVRQVGTLDPYTVTTLVSTGLTNPTQLEVGRNGSYVYVLDENETLSTIKRVATSGSYTVTTLVSNTVDTPVDRLYDITLDPANDFVYWLDYDDTAVRRVATDGAIGTFETLTTNTGRYPTDLTVSPDGGSVYWLETDNDQVRRIAADGSSLVQVVVTSSHTTQNLIEVAEETETIDSSCITDAGAFDAGHATHDWETDVGQDWEANIDATCPSAFYTFRLADAADLRITARSSSINPVPILRRGGIDGDLVALTDWTTGASTPYVYPAEAGQYTIELVRAKNSSEIYGGFAARLQIQPMLSDCDVDLGTLDSDQVQIFGAYDADCGDTRKYFFHLEFEGEVSASASATGFTPRIELRPGAASDSSSPTAQDLDNPADIYQSLTSGWYRVNVENIIVGGSYRLAMQAFGLPPPTRTPVPSPTPRFQPNRDVRLDPDPRGTRYQPNEVYRFRLEGTAGYFPVTVRATNAEAVKVSAGDSDALDCEGEAEIQGANPLDLIHVHICAAGFNATLQLVNEADGGLLAQYTIFVAGAGAVAPDGTVPGPGTPQDEDHIGVGIFVSALCEAMNLDCDVGLVRNGVGALGSLGMFAGATQVARGRANPFLIGIGVALFLIGLVLANELMGVPIYWAGIGFISVFMVALVAAAIKFQRLRT